jgi:hypothetical protein
MVEDGEAGLLAEAIAALQSRAATSGQSGLPRYPFHCIPSSGSCRRIIYSTKGDWLLRLTDDPIPDDVAMVWRVGPLGPSERAFVRGVVGLLAAPVFFVGDLDPLDLAAYATLVAEATLANASYLGVSGTWLDACEADLVAHRRSALKQVCIPMDDAERAGWATLRDVGIDWPHVVGPRAVSLLDSGVKLELEGASNRELYSPEFRRGLVRALFA